MVISEIESLANGSGSFHTLISYIPKGCYPSVNDKLSKYNVHKIISIGYREEFNYIVKDDSICTIIGEEIV